MNDEYIFELLDGLKRSGGVQISEAPRLLHVTFDLSENESTRLVEKWTERHK